MAAYQVLARKFRPRAFDDVVGQTHVTRTLRNAIRMERIHHAFLFTGTRGCGKTSTARILAKALNCQKAGKDLDPCNECDSCREITAGSSLDVLEIDGASNNGVDAIRELRENVRFMPNKGKFKIYIVDEVHMLSNAAFNALLKTLEEPPAHVIFIFATTEPHELPTTILSRCQRFDFKRIPPKRIAERLEQIAEAEGITISPAGLSQLARAAEGSMRDAQSLFDQVISFAGRDEASGKTKISDDQITESLGLIDRRLFQDLLEALAARDAKRSLDVAQRVALAGYEVPHFAREMLARIRDLMVVKVVAEPDRLVDLSAEELESLKTAAGFFTREEVDSLFLMLESSLEEMVRGGLPQLALEMAVLRMAAVEPIAPIAELVARLEGGGGGGPSPSGPSRGTGAGRSAEGGAATIRGWKPPDERPANRGASSPERSAAPATPPAAIAAVAPPAVAVRTSIEDLSPEISITRTIEAPIFDWSAFLSYVKNRKPLLGVLIGEGHLARFTGDEIQIGYDTSGIRSDQVRDKDNVEAITKLATEFLKRPMTVKIVAAVAGKTPDRSSAPRPAQEPPRGNPVEERRKLREEALANDAVKQAMDVLGAELAEVRPAGTGKG